jgi:hypothetical protein
MREERNVNLYIVCIFLSGLVIFISSCSGFKKNTSIEIISCVVRDRVIMLDHLTVRSMIIVGLKIIPGTENLSTPRVTGALYNNKKLLSQDTIMKPDSKANNLEFDIPLSEGSFSYEQPMRIADGRYRIVVKLLDEKKNLIAETEKVLERNQIGRTFYGFDKVYEQPRYILLKNEEVNKGSPRLWSEGREQTNDEREQRAREYVIFQKNYLERVYQNTKPEKHELIKEISAEISRNEYKPLTFSIRAMKNLGKVKIAISTMRDKQGKLVNISVNIGPVDQLTEIVREDHKKNIVFYRYAPRIIENKEVSIPSKYTQTYWITMKTDSGVKPGDYYGNIRITPQAGKQGEIPVHLKVLPLTLTDTDKQYGMMMDYAFYEMDEDTWPTDEKTIIQKRGIEIYRDLRDHGMTLIYPHSHFFYIADGNGEPILNSLRESLATYKSLQLPGPFVWYLGHLLQTAKVIHPGSILNYDEEVAKRRLRDLLSRFEMMAKELGIPKDQLIVQLVDEPDPDQEERNKAGKELHKVAKELGFKTLITRPWPDVDVICTGIPDNEQRAEQLRKMGREWWIYPNNTLNGKNLAYTRYVFGFGAWRWGVDGVVPWTYQMSQGSNGNPFTVLDGPEVMVTYPGIKGPISTPVWESIRDGINDYKYIYQLEKYIYAKKKHKNSKAFLIDEKLKQFKQNLGRRPGPEESVYGDWSPNSFAKNRKQIVKWLLELM